MSQQKNRLDHHSHRAVRAADESAPRPLLVRQLNANTALVFGNEADAGAFGVSLDKLDGNIVSAIVAGNAAIQSALAIGDASGRLVRLTTESANALRQFGPTLDSSGAIMGVARDGSGKFTKLMRFSSASRLEAAAAVGPALAAMALQIQLQTISRQLSEISEVVERLEQNRDDLLASSVETNVQEAQRAYDLLQLSGTISDSE